jgi:hypothetical protein
MKCTSPLKKYVLDKIVFYGEGKREWVREVYTNIILENRGYKTIFSVILHSFSLKIKRKIQI